jgi:hypothetical protein
VLVVLVISRSAILALDPDEILSHELLLLSLRLQSTVRCVDLYQRPAHRLQNLEKLGCIVGIEELESHRQSVSEADNKPYKLGSIIYVYDPWSGAVRPGAMLPHLAAGATVYSTLQWSLWKSEKSTIEPLNPPFFRESTIV